MLCAGEHVEGDYKEDVAILFTHKIQGVCFQVEVLNTREVLDVRKMLITSSFRKTEVGIVVVVKW